MKKQILILFLAFFAAGNLFGQLNNPAHNVAPNCTGSAANPAVGQLYTYEVAIPAGAFSQTAGQYTWYVMNQGELNLLNNPAGVIPASNAFFTATGTYNTATVGQNTIDLTWTSAALATGEPYYLVVVYNDPTAGCATNNMKVYRIEPQNTFWLAIESADYSQCSPNVASANLNLAGTEVEYTYGQNTIVATVTASGYAGVWDAELDLDGFAIGQSVTVSWTSTSNSTGATFADPGANNGIYTASLPSTVAGEVITITITIDNNHFENLAGQTIDIAINGSYTSGTSTFYDMWAGVAGDACLPDPDFNDAITHTISARPTINPVNPPTFVPQVP